MFEQLITNLISFFNKRAIEIKNFFKNRRIEFNYEKDGFTQIFPILYIENDNEKELLFGVWKYNIAFVKGRNAIPINPIFEEGEINMEERGLFSDYKKNPNGLTNKQKTMIVFIVMGTALVGAIVLYQAFKKRK